MKHPLLVTAMAALLSMAYCTQPQQPRQIKQDKKAPYKINLKHKQDLIYQASNSVGGGWVSFTLQGLTVDSAYIAHMRKMEPSYPIPGSRYNHVKVILRDHVTGEEEVLAEK